MLERPELLDVGLYETYQVDKEKSVGDLVRELNLGDSSLYGILVNGRKVDEGYRIKDTDKVVILPILAGGC